MDTSKKNFRPDRSCEACGNEGAALASTDVAAVPHYLCETCMKLGLSRRMSTEQIVTLVEKHWGTGADAAEVDKCPKCGSDRILVRSMDGQRYFVKCGCMTQEGFGGARLFRIG